MIGRQENNLDIFIRRWVREKYLMKRDKQLGKVVCTYIQFLTVNELGYVYCTMYVQLLGTYEWINVIVRREIRHSPLETSCRRRLKGLQSSIRKYDKNTLTPTLKKIQVISLSQTS